MAWHYSNISVDVASDTDYTHYVWCCSNCGKLNNVLVKSNSLPPVFVKCCNCGVSFEEDCKNDSKRSKAEN